MIVPKYRCVTLDKYKADYNTATKERESSDSWENVKQRNTIFENPIPFPDPGNPFLKTPSHSLPIVQKVVRSRLILLGALRLHAVYLSVLANVPILVIGLHLLVLLSGCQYSYLNITAKGANIQLSRSQSYPSTPVQSASRLPTSACT